jgi:hypothetical protein
MGDEKLSKLISNFKDVENNQENRTGLLTKAYGIVAPDGFKLEKYQDSIKKEAVQLNSGAEHLAKHYLKELKTNKATAEQWGHLNESVEVFKNKPVENSTGPKFKWAKTQKPNNENSQGQTTATSQKITTTITHN